jgi:predicted PurR-regulated permease PerM
MCVNGILTGDMPTKIEISHRTIIFTLVLIAAIWLILEIRDILFLLFISFILMSALRPIVDGMERLKIPRIVSIFLLYGLVFGGLGAGLASMVPTLAVQSGKLLMQLPDVLSRVFPYISSDVQSLIQQVAPVGENLVKVTVGVFSNVLAVLTVMTFTFYFLLERRHLQDFLSALLGAEPGERVFDVLLRIEKRLGSWVLGELCLMAFVGLLAYGGLFFLRVEYALPLAILAGVLEIVPTIGPTVSAIPAVLVALGSSPILALSVVALYIIVQQIENNLLVPLVMKRSVGLPPVLTILALMIGGRFGGVTGAVLAVPVLLAIQEVINSFPITSKPKKI